MNLQEASLFVEYDGGAHAPAVDGDQRVAECGRDLWICGLKTCRRSSTNSNECESSACASCSATTRLSKAFRVSTGWSSVSLRRSRCTCSTTAWISCSLAPSSSLRERVSASSTAARVACDAVPATAAYLLLTATASVWVISADNFALLQKSAAATPDSAMLLIK